MLKHSTANCKVSQIFSVFGIFLRNYCSDLDQTLIFVHAVVLCSHLHQLQMFLQFFALFLGTSGLILINLWFLFMLCHSTANYKVSKFSHFFAFFLGTTGFILIKLWFLFMLWYSAVSCKVSQFFALFIGSTGLILINLWFLFILCHSAANRKVSKFSHIFAFFWRTTGLHQTLIFVHAVAFCSQLQSFTNFSVFCIFLRNYWFDLDQTLIFVHAVSLCSHLQLLQIFFTFLHFSQELLVWSWTNFDICPCCGTLQPIVKFQNFSHFFAFFSGTTGLILIKSFIFVYAVPLYSQL